MKNLKRTTSKYGKVLGHRAGVNSETLLSYREARFKIYLPSYKWALDHYLQKEILELRRKSQESKIILLDYETNCDLNDLSSPLSHAGLIRLYITCEWP